MVEQQAVFLTGHYDGSGNLVQSEFCCAPRGDFENT